MYKPLKFQFLVAIQIDISDENKFSCTMLDYELHVKLLPPSGPKIFYSRLMSGCVASVGNVTFDLSFK